MVRILVLLPMLFVANGCFASDNLAAAGGESSRKNTAPASKGSGGLVEYLHKGSCPFECCSYGTWSSKNRIEVVETPRGTTIVASIFPGEKFEAITGDVFVTPVKMKVIFPHKDFVLGDTFYLLDSTSGGEGYHYAWYKGNVLQDDFGFLWDDSIDKTMASDENWAKPTIITEDIEPKISWWVNVKTNKGVKGWINVDLAEIVGLGDCN